MSLFKKNILLELLLFKELFEKGVLKLRLWGEGEGEVFGVFCGVVGVGVVLL